MCSYLLDSGLAASKLPAAMQDHVRKQFTDRVFSPADLATAIDEARELMSSLTGAASSPVPPASPACSPARINCNWQSTISWV
jgi:hypothetical protein